MSKDNNKEIPNPWGHSISFAANIKPKNEDDVTSTGIVATCTCGEWKHEFPNDADAEYIGDVLQAHRDTHPLMPLSIAEIECGETDDEHQIAMVFAVPGAGEDPVHMTITVSKKIYKDGAQLAKHIGSVGSPIHFETFARRRKFKKESESRGMKMVEVPLSHDLAKSVLSMLDEVRREHGNDDDPGVALFEQQDAHKSIVDHLTGFLNEGPTPDIVRGPDGELRWQMPKDTGIPEPTDEGLFHSDTEQDRTP